MVSALEDLPVELFYEIFTYFQFHEIWNIFWHVNSRISAIIENIPSISVYLGCSGITIEVANFYYKYVSQLNLGTRLTSLCVSDTCSVGNSLWFAKDGSRFINLRYLSLIDVKRSSFEIILDSLSPIDSLIMFSVHFVSADHRAACTFVGVPEGAYHERIFRLFLSLRVCHLLFDRKERHTIQTLLLTTPTRSSVSIQSNLSNLRSLTLRYCTPGYLSHLFEHLPQLEEFSCHLYNMSLCTLQQHSPEHDYDKYVSLFDMMYLN